MAPIAWEFMSYCDKKKKKIFAHPVSYLCRDQISIVNQNIYRKFVWLKVSNREAPNYSSIIKKRMALSHMKTKGNYGTLESFGEDIQLIVENCKLYNAGNANFVEVRNNY